MLELNTIYNEDCIGEKGMCLIPDGSIDMVLCDLPYGTVKDMGIDGWKNKGENCSWDDQLNIEKMFIQYERILRENGNIILFSQEPYTSVLRTYNATNIEFAYPLIWKKDHFANALIAKKAPVSYFEDLSVFYKKYDTQNLNPLRKYFYEMANYIGINNCKQINEILGNRKAEYSFYVFGKNEVKKLGQKTDHVMRIGSTQFKLCTESTYNDIISKLHIDKWEGFKTYKELSTINAKYQRVFNLPKDQKVKSNVLEFKKDYQGLHPTQKPIALLEDLINTYSNEGETVLDNCIGSGSTAIACLNTKRNYIGFETDEKYYQLSLERIKNHKIA